MPENFSALTRLAESTERIALALEKIANSAANTHTEESKERQETQEKTTQKGSAGATGEGGLSPFFKGFTELYAKVEKAAVTPSHVVADAMASLTNSRQAQAGLVAPADRILSEVQQLSEAGQYLTGGEAEVYGAGVAQEQQAMKYNMKLLQQYVHRGTWNNIKDKWGTWKLDVDDDLSNYGTFGMIPRQAKKAWNEISETASDYVKKHFRRNQGLDALGRD